MGDQTERRIRLDAELLCRGLVTSRTQAQAAIAAGKVTVDGSVALKPGQLVSEASVIDAEPPHPWVSRGGLKLAHALDAFGVNPIDRACLDIGASTGGFTDVLLTRGARSVVAVDVGRGQLAGRLKQDARVRSLEGQDARGLTPEIVGEAPSLIVCDASFIGLSKVLACPLSLAAEGADAVVLFKPQFEVGPAHVGKGGIVTDDAATDRAATEFARWAEVEGWKIRSWIESPIRGGDGNRERLVHAQRS